jgi:predicted ribosomally synthesized peptide with nif11-like leader
MSTDNISAFFAKAQSDPALADKLGLATAEAFASVARQEGLPFTAEEFLSFQTSELSDESLTRVAGGIFELSRNHTRLY